MDKYSPDPHLMQQNNAPRKGLNNLVALLITMKTRWLMIFYGELESQNYKKIHERKWSNFRLTDLDLILPRKTEIFRNFHDATRISFTPHQNINSLTDLFPCHSNVRNHISCYNFALVLHENTLVFSQSEANKYFMYIIRANISSTTLGDISMMIVNIKIY